MSTTAIISIEGFKNFHLYKHWDGYPEATLKWLETFNKQFIENRGAEFENQYKAAQLVRSSVIMRDPSQYTGWGIVTDDNWYADYHYILKLDGAVEVIDL